MNIDVTALRSLVREKDVSFDTVVEAIEGGVVAAYQHTKGAQPHARAKTRCKILRYGDDIGADQEGHEQENNDHFRQRGHPLR